MAFQAIDFKRNVFRWKKSFSMASKICFIFSWEEDFVAKNRTRESREHIALSFLLLTVHICLLIIEQARNLDFFVDLWSCFASFPTNFQSLMNCIDLDEAKAWYNWISWNISRRSSLQICASVLQINFNRVVSGLDYRSVQKPHSFFLISFYSAAGSEELCLSFPRCGKSAYFFFRLILR